MPIPANQIQPLHGAFLIAESRDEFFWCHIHPTNFDNGLNKMQLTEEIIRRIAPRAREDYVAALVSGGDAKAILKSQNLD